MCFLCLQIWRLGLYKDRLSTHGKRRLLEASQVLVVREGTEDGEEGLLVAELLTTLSEVFQPFEKCLYGYLH